MQILHRILHKKLLIKAGNFKLEYHDECKGKEWSEERVKIFDKLKVSKACEKARGMSAQRQGGEFDTNQCIIVEIFWKRGMSGQSLGGGCEKPIINT